MRGAGRTRVARARGAGAAWRAAFCTLLNKRPGRVLVGGEGLAEIEAVCRGLCVCRGKRGKIAKAGTMANRPQTGYVALLVGWNRAVGGVMKREGSASGGRCEM